MLSKILLLLSAVMLVISLFVPLWQIDLDAPQYPEGLKLLIWPNKIAGDVDIINGLNHYIGMKTLHTGDFIEFTILPYLIAGFALLFAASAMVGKKRWLHFSFSALVVFGIVAMTDFWLWEYQYGHDLDPNAAIKVPGMAYQPPLIGFKQLLNFGAYSIPAAGGFLFLFAGVLLLFAILRENKVFCKLKSSQSAAFLVAGLTVTACGSDRPQEIKLNTDACQFCRMTISDGHFGAEIITTKSRVFMFDDVSCLLGFISEHHDTAIRRYFVHDYQENNVLIDATEAWYVHSSDLKSPMGGNLAAFSTEADAHTYASQINAEVVRWPEVEKRNPGNEHGRSHEHH